ncbi:MAG: helix-turn-helix transcriptional regulator [Candidatus Binatus sp.]|uniref:helix-turn-helix domain-containing protein n=1 Tax=Candidatus Binatus sp. TaxID=2811406 RepID=UPI003C74C59C
MSRQKRDTPGDNTAADTVVSPDVRSHLQELARKAANRDAHSGFSERLQELVADAGSIAAVAAQARVSEGAVRMWLSRVEPTREKLAALAKATGVSLDWLMTGRGPKVYSEYPPGYVAMRFADLTESKGIATRPFFSREHFISLPLSLLGISESEQASIDPMALLLPPEADSSEADFVVFNFAQPGVPETLREGTPCVVIDHDERVKVLPARNLAGTVLGPVIFRGAVVRRRASRADG